MKAARGWIVLALIAVAIATTAYLLQPRNNDSPEHSSNSDAANKLLRYEYRAPYRFPG